MNDNNLTSKIVLAINWLLAFVYYRMLNWPKIIYQAKIPKVTGILFVSSHYTMSDSWLLGTLFNILDLFRNFDFIPYNLPDEINFVLGKSKMPKKFGFLNYFIYPIHLIINGWFKHSKCIPVNRKTGGKEARAKVIDILSNARSNVLMFPGSGRRRKNQPIKISASVGKIICEAKPKLIIPIRLIGLPYKGKFISIIFRRPLVIIGKPLEIPELITAQTEEDYRLIAKKIIDAIENLMLP